MKTVAVLGGGVAGVVVAKSLADRGVRVDLIERSGRLGGLHRSVNIDDCTFDIGAFLFSANHELLRTFPFLQQSFVRTSVQNRSVTRSGALCRYPLTVKSYVDDANIAQLLLTVPDLLLCKVRYRRRDTVPAFAKYYVGSLVYELSGLRNYIERMNGVKDYELGIEFAEQRLVTMKQYTPSHLFATRVLRRSMFPATAFTDLVRPHAGFQAVYEQIGQHLNDLGVAVRLDCAVSAARRDGEGFVLTADGVESRYDAVVSTIPIPVMLRLLGLSCDARFDQLALHSIFYRGRVRDRGACLYNFSMAGLWKRITVFSSFYGRAGDDDYFTVEVTTRDTSSPALETHRRDFEEHAERLGLLDGRPSYLGHEVTERAYPVFRKGDRAALDRERNKLLAQGVRLVGRQGNFEYLTSSDTAKKAAAASAGI